MRGPRTIALGIALVVGACAGGGAPNALPVDVLHTSVQCGTAAGPSVRRIQDAAALRAAMAPGLGMVDSGTGGVTVPPPGVAMLWRVDMGERPTAGYGLAIMRAEHSARRLVLYFDWQEPEPGAIVAQVITQPCVILRLPPVEIDEVQVLDRAGRVRIAQRLTR